MDGISCDIATKDCHQLCSFIGLLNFHPANLKPDIFVQLVDTNIGLNFSTIITTITS